MSARSSQSHTSTPSNILEQVRQCAASVTRYPLDILTEHAQLEDELGIDSVKLAEIAAVIAREFQLPPDRLPRNGKARTLGAIAGAVTEALGTQPGPSLHVAAPVAPAPAVAEAKAGTGAPATQDLLPRVRAVFARVTRYPEELLTPHADLEDELGIDSVKQAEVMAVLMKELGLGDAPKPSQRLRTMAAIADAARALLPAAPPVAEARPRAPVVHAAPAPVVSRTDLPFAGKVALVTGSGKGIGRVIATRLARAGATVVVNSFHSREDGEKTARDIVDAGGKAVHLWGSVAQEEHLERMFAAIREQLGGLDLLVCNASNGLIGPFDRIAPRDWDKAFRTCITGTYECAMRARPLMAARGGGSIVTMSTSMSQRYMHDLGCQGVVKAGVESLTRYLAAELAPEGIRTNCVSAGPVHGDLLGMFPDAPERVARWESATPGGRLCTADDVADVTELLLGPKTQRVNGAIWVVDAGLSGTVDGLLPAARAS
ncbi:short-chain dehydrogenase/reductase [Corallococcus coralloides DSM 2259]|uniref:Short-chain dehydrogenase/reductase n=1 Tax=Corallococcus coralloides (strain ATCC 25202 / DSM 2259 / NBRC 100086 / M2) TaxID=1144275 RepID=H8MKD6_CORCM|nr:SDR family oxidoreductase [Corallococcus coralloides]AFE08717.1 short-chain dehydrogenase/reductase [Corallococcus coralloides DSM 2259]